MRSVTFLYRDRESLERDLARDAPELPLPKGERAEDGEWVLAVIKVEPLGLTAAVAACVEERRGGHAIVFEVRDWDALKQQLGFGEPTSTRTPRRSKRTGARPASSRRSGGGKKGEDKAPSSRAIPSAPAAGRPGTMPPPSRSGAVLTRTLMPPAREPHEADLPDHTLEAPVRNSLPQTKRPARILVVDDDVDTQLLLREMMAAIDIDVECASDAEEALDRLALEPIDIVVLDWTLPGMTGLELCREIRKDARFAALPVLFLTGRTSQRDLVDAFAAGADDFVPKPFRAPELGARLFALLRRARISLSLSPPPNDRR